MEKVVRDGCVAVLVSPDYGAGWYTWNRNRRECLFDPEVVSWVEGGKIGSVPDLATKYNWDDFYDGGAESLIVVWVPKDARFRIKEYDGYETLILEATEMDQKEYITA